MNTPTEPATAACTELDQARRLAAAWLLVADAASRDVQVLLAALRTTVSWCENPNNRTMHTLRQQCSMLDALRTLAKTALDSVPDEPRNPASGEVSLLTGNEFRALLDLVMCSDPWPIKGMAGAAAQTTLKELLNREAKRRGCISWVEAYHRFMPQPESAQR